MVAGPEEGPLPVGKAPGEIIAVVGSVLTQASFLAIYISWELRAGTVTIVVVCAAAPRLGLVPGPLARGDSGYSTAFAGPKVVPCDATPGVAARIPGTVRAPLARKICFLG